MKIAVRDLRPNPFRHLERYPISQDKVDALKQSIKQTSFWDNLLVRKSPDKPSCFEIAYGHHRLAALKAARIEEIDVPVRALDDTAMCRIMAHENMEEWGHSTAIEQETVRAIIEAYAAGKIKLPTVNKGTTRGTIRIAPSFKVNSDGEEFAQAKPSYTAETLAVFLGWKEYKVGTTLAALALIEDNLATERQFTGLSTRQAAAITQETRRVARETENPALARAVGRRLAVGMRQSSEGRDRAGRERNVQDVTIHNARQRANEMVPRQSRIERTMPPIDTFAEQLALVLVDIFPTPRIQEKLDAIIQYRSELGTRERNKLVGALRALAKRAERFAEKLEG
jgi:ParB-like nuclease domain